MNFITAARHGATAKKRAKSSAGFTSAGRSNSRPSITRRRLWRKTQRPALTGADSALLRAVPNRGRHKHCRNVISPGRSGISTIAILCGVLPDGCLTRKAAAIRYSLLAIRFLERTPAHADHHRYHRIFGRAGAALGRRYGVPAPARIHTDPGRARA